MEGYGFDVVDNGIAVYTIEECLEKIDKSMQSYVQFPNKSIVYTAMPLSTTSKP